MNQPRKDMDEVFGALAVVLVVITAALVLWVVRWDPNERFWFETPRAETPGTDARIARESADKIRVIHAAARAFNGVRVHESTWNSLLADLADKHAQSMASRRNQDHDGFEKRAESIRQQLGLSAAEICAESWPRQSDDSEFELWTEMFRCWRQSPGHWSVASKGHKLWGGSMRQGRNGIWYAAILVAD